jgi:hypothetical protein
MPEIVTWLSPAIATNARTVPMRRPPTANRSSVHVSPRTGARRDEQ